MVLPISVIFAIKGGFSLSMLQSLNTFQQSNWPRLVQRRTRGTIANTFLTLCACFSLSNHPAAVEIFSVLTIVFLRFASFKLRSLRHTESVKMYHYYYTHVLKGPIG